MNISDFIYISQQKLENPNNWIQGDYARNKYDIPVGTDSPDACKFCSLGVIRNTLNYNSLSDCYRLDDFIYDKALIVIQNQIDWHIKIYQFNDTHEHGDVMHMFNKARQQALDIESNDLCPEIS